MAKKNLEKKNLCKCGCGTLVRQTWAIGHNPKPRRNPKNKKPVTKNRYNYKGLYKQYKDRYDQEVQKVKELEKILADNNLYQKGTKPITLTEQILKLEEEANKKIQEIVQKLVDTTGVHPEIIVEIQFNEEFDEDEKVWKKVDVYKPEPISGMTSEPMRTAVRRLVNYCYHHKTSKFIDKNDVRKWIMRKLNDNLPRSKQFDLC